jgi:dTDP-4-dehydrorhamnose 3,5-epimerase
MKITPSTISGAWLIESKRFEDDRGWFQEWFKKSIVLHDCNFEFKPSQINISHSRQGVIRGVHYSIAPEGQAKLVTVISGIIDDYIVDTRIGSPTFGTWERVRLNSEHGNSVLLSPHMAHAFQAISLEATVCYAVSTEFNPLAEKEINPYCPTLAIKWSSEVSAVLSPKDQAAPNLEEQKAEGMLSIFE